MKIGAKDSRASLLAAVLTGWWYLMACILALAFCLVSLSFLGIPAGLQVSIPVSFYVNAPPHRVAAPVLDIADAEVQGIDFPRGMGFEISRKLDAGHQSFLVNGSLKFPSQRGAFLAVNAVILLGSLSLMLWVLGQLCAVFQTIRDGQPFVPANASRIRWIGNAVILGELARSAVAHLEARYVLTHFVAEGLRFIAPLHLNILALINGLIILVIAEVFRAGTRLDEEQSLTV